MKLSLLLFVLFFHGNIYSACYTQRIDTLAESKELVKLSTINNIKTIQIKGKRERLKESIYRKYKKAQVGDIAYDFIALNSTGDSVIFSDVGNAYRLLVFTSSICTSCIESLEELQNLKSKHQDSLSIVSFYIDQKKETWLYFSKKRMKSWVCLWDSQDWSNETVIKYGVSGVPTFFLIDRKGVIIKMIRGYKKDSLEKELFIDSDNTTLKRGT